MTVPRRLEGRLDLRHVGEARDWADGAELLLDEEAHRRLHTVDDGRREDKSRDKQWRCYRALAIAVGSLQEQGSTYAQALHALQARLDSYGANAHTALLKALNEEQKRVQNADGIAKRVLGC